jgi:hypothetical protein
MEWNVTTGTLDAGDAAARIDEDKLATAREALVKGWKKRRGDKRHEPVTQSEWFALAPGIGTNTLRLAFLELLDDERIAERQVEVVDKAGATRKKWRFELAESAFEQDAA